MAVYLLPGIENSRAGAEVAAYSVSHERFIVRDIIIMKKCQQVIDLSPKVFFASAPFFWGALFLY